MAFSYENIPDALLEEAVESHFGQFAMERKSQFYNFVCPFCGDMNRPNKKKAYVYKDTWLFKCFKCGISQHIMKYLKENDDAAYGRILMYGFDDSDREERNAKKKAELDSEKKRKSELPFADGELVSLMDNDPLAGKAVEFCKRRHIREAVYEKWFVCREGQEFMRRDSAGALVLNENGVPMGNEFRNRVIIPFYRYGGTWGQFDARALDPENPLRYRNFEGVKRQAYNIDFVDFTQPFYILEGTIDSTFIHNSLAIGGISHFDEVIADNPDIEKYKANCTVIWDNDSAGELARLDSVKKGYNWFDWSGIKEKDVNGAVLSGEMPVDSKGFVDAEFIKDRSRPPEGATILFALTAGDMAERKKAEQREQRRQMLEKMAAKRKLEVFF